MNPTIKITVLGLLSVATLAGCSKHDDDKILDTGRGEIHLSTATQAHRSRADLFSPDVQIAASQQVGLHITKADGSPLYTNYAYTADGLGGLALPSDVSTPYYPKDGGNVKISAYHPHLSNSAAYDFVVATNQSTDADYYSSDLLFSAPKEYRRQTAAHLLTFEHVLSKATYTLVAGTGSPNLTGATVEFLDLECAVRFDPEMGTVTMANTSVKGNITPHATYGAIVAPQTVSAGKNLIKVTLSDGTVLYHKAPVGGQTFAQGVKYHFTITVKYDELKMTVQTAPWEPVGNVAGDAELGEGLPLDQAQVGDFYCMDGFGGYILPKDAILSDAQKAACVGIVFWLGDPTNTTNGDPLLATQHSGCTHGLVVALHDAKQPSASAAARMKWSVSYEQVNNWTNHVDRGDNKVNITEQNRYQGYANTVALKAYNNESTNVQGDPNFKVLPIAAIERYQMDYPTPSNSSGWYVPSILELKYMCWGQGNGQSTIGRDLLNGQFAKVGGTNFDGTSSWRYWSSSEDADFSSNAWRVDFSYGSVGYSNKDGFEFWVRPIFAF